MTSRSGTRIATHRSTRWRKTPTCARHPEHYRQASKEQREQEQRRHESQVQQLQLELRQLQQTLIIKQDELTQLNRDNARLLTEARQLQKSDMHSNS